MQHAPLDFGIKAGDRPWLRHLGSSLAELGYAGVWANDNPGRSGLASLAALALDAPSLELGLGVAPLATRPAEELVSEVRALDLPRDRLILGVGSGSSSSLALVREGIATLRRELPSVRLAISALGPRMCTLGGEIADLVLLNWAGPDRTRWSRERIAEGAATGGRAVPTVAAYVRVAVGPNASERLAAERARYAGMSGAYGRLFAGQPDGAVLGFAADDAAAVPAGVAPYREVLDRCVIRGLPANDDLDGWLAVARAATLGA